MVRVRDVRHASDDLRIMETTPLRMALWTHGPIHRVMETLAYTCHYGDTSKLGIMDTRAHAWHYGHTGLHMALWNQLLYAWHFGHNGLHMALLTHWPAHGIVDTLAYTWYYGHTGPCMALWTHSAGLEFHLSSRHQDFSSILRARHFSFMRQ